MAYILVKSHHEVPLCVNNRRRRHTSYYFTHVGNYERDMGVAAAQCLPLHRRLSLSPRNR